jgi:hypothetical protein
MDEKQFQEAVAALWQHVRAAKVLQDAGVLRPNIIEEINCITNAKLRDLSTALHINAGGRI